MTVSRQSAVEIRRSEGASSQSVDERLPSRRWLPALGHLSHQCEKCR